MIGVVIMLAVVAWLLIDVRDVLKDIAKRLPSPRKEGDNG